jgi:hypothetical protein
MPKVNRRPIAENYSNLVTLLDASAQINAIPAVHPLRETKQNYFEALH